MGDLFASLGTPGLIGLVVIAFIVFCMMKGGASDNNSQNNGQKNNQNNPSKEKTKPVETPKQN